MLAYAGAALPVLLIFNTAGTPFSDAVGLIAAVPLTTAIAALPASRLPPAALPDERHAH